MSQGLCRRCGTPNKYFATKCRQCGDVLQWADISSKRPPTPIGDQPTAVPTTKSQVASKKPTIEQSEELDFRPLSSDEIRAACKSELRSKNSIASIESLGITAYVSGGGCLTGILLCFLPIIGWILGPLFILGSILAFIGIFGADIYTRSMAVTDAKILGHAQKMKRMCRGKCPICQNVVVLKPTRDREYVECPTCKGPLMYEDGQVEPY
jgi:endogenous inhibitor of DNA gyrase (YacG/DUF329 family)